jgi:hypothetical protein
MKRNEQYEINKRVILSVYSLLDDGENWAQSYKAVCSKLNSIGHTTSRGNNWTPKRLFRMLQRSGISGLHGLKEAQKKGISGHYKKDLTLN